MLLKDLGIIENENGKKYRFGLYLCEKCNIQFTRTL